MTTKTLPTKRIKKATLYIQGVFGYSTIEVNDLDIKTGAYAQYNNAIFLEYRKKRARKRVRQVLSYSPQGVVVEGWGHPKFDNFGKRQRSESGVVFSKGLHTGCSPEWAGTLSSFLDANVLTPVADFHGWNSYSGGYSNS